MHCYNQKPKFGNGDTNTKRFVLCSQNLSQNNKKHIQEEKTATKKVHRHLFMDPYFAFHALQVIVFHPHHTHSSILPGHTPQIKCVEKIFSENNYSDVISGQVYYLRDITKLEKETGVKTIQNSLKFKCILSLRTQINK